MLDTHTAAFVGRWIQTAVVPDDIHASMRELSRTLGAGPWFLREPGVFPNQLDQGQSSTKALAIAMGYVGDMQSLTFADEAEVANGARVGYFDTHGRFPIAAARSLAAASHHRLASRTGAHTFLESKPSIRFSEF